LLEKVVFSDVATHALVGMHRRFRKTCRPHYKKNLRNYTASHDKRP